MKFLAVADQAGYVVNLLVHMRVMVDNMPHGNAGRIGRLYEPMMGGMACRNDQAFSPLGLGRFCHAGRMTNHED
jgi:hypothetical protein